MENAILTIIIIAVQVMINETAPPAAADLPFCIDYWLYRIVHCTNLTTGEVEILTYTQMGW